MTAPLLAGTRPAPRPLPLLVLCLGLAAGFNLLAAEPETPSPEAGTPLADESDRRGATTLTGVVRVPVDADRPWRYRRHLKPGGGGELRGAVVCLTAPGLGRRAPPSKPAEHTLDQRDLQFVPQTLAFRAGDRVRFTNSDGHLHNVTIVDDLKTLNFSLHREDTHVETFERAGGLRRPHAATCNLHAQMQAWLCVFDHPWFAVTDQDGAFTLRNVPPGEYRIEALHAHSGEIVETRVTVSADKPLPVELRLRGR
jgi:plastocyanin